MTFLINSSFRVYKFSLESLLIALIFISSIQHLSLAQQFRSDEGVLRRRLLGFKETPVGGNSTFDCSPSGPCVPCQYSEKNDDKYRCSETGYRIPFKCVNTIAVAQKADGENPKNSHSTQDESPVDMDNSAVKDRRLTDNDSSEGGESHTYVTYRSCVQAVNEEKLSVLGFEVLMLGALLISGSLIFLRRKQSVAMTGAGGGLRIQSNSRF